ncbi:hypothetical protein EDC01DRAFT_608729 [Geopyxis carbonaria]|nr:hypothetical protein EDC01DRAFT_608729 [Geopyxis carbonaria]
MNPETPLPRGYTSLAAASRSAANSFVDVIGVVIDWQEPFQTQRGARDWTCTITICDKSLPTGIKARFFQKQFDHLPAVSNVGDVFILTSMKVSSFKGEPVLLSTFGFSWVGNIIRQGQKPLIKKHPTSSSSFTIQDNNYITHLRSWWVIYLKDKNPTGSSAVGGSVVSSGGSRRKMELVKNMKLDTYYDMVGYVIKTFPGVTTEEFDNYTVYITDYTSNPMLYDYKMGEDNGEVQGTKWNGPWGKYTLQVTLWDNNAAAARQLLQEGSYIQITNIRARKNRDGNLEGWVHGDARGNVNFYALDEKGDSRVMELVARSKEYARKFKPKKDHKKEVDEQKIVKNPSVRCYRPNHTTTLIGEIKKPADGDIESYRNKKYRTVCRIIDFMPERLEDFTRSERWIWRFALLVEGLDGELMQVIVDSGDAEHLLKLTATDLRKDDATLTRLREVLMLMWDDVEQRKTAALEKAIEQKQVPQADKDAAAATKKRKRQLSRKKAKKARQNGKPIIRDHSSDGEDEPSEDLEKYPYGTSRYFDCCLMEYGVPLKNEAWIRRWKLHGTTVG